MNRRRPIALAFTALCMRAELADLIRRWMRPQSVTLIWTVPPMAHSAERPAAVACLAECK